MLGGDKPGTEVMRECGSWGKEEGTSLGHAGLEAHVGGSRLLTEPKLAG